MSTSHSYSATNNTHPAAAATAPVPNSDPPLPCPRCDSRDTKFCYYNNYNPTQPRHFCRTCRRYWTRGGTLRNVPVGGGCRKNKHAYNNNPSDLLDRFRVLNAQESEMGCNNGFRLIQSEAAPVEQPFRVENMSQYVMNGYDESYDEYSNVEFGSVNSGDIPDIDSGFGYWNPGSAWPNYTTTSGAFL